MIAEMGSKKLEIDISQLSLNILNDMYHYYDEQLEFDFKKKVAIIAKIEYKR